MIVSKARNYFDTIIRLNPSQILFRFIRLFKISRYKINSFDGNVAQLNHTIFPEIIEDYSQPMYSSPSHFFFINEVNKVDSFINIKNKKKLWRYNLYYFNYLNYFSHKKDIDINFSKYIDTWISEVNKGEPLEPYPTSLRIVNWIKWSIRNKYYKKSFLDSLYSQSIFLKKNIEYDIKGNHIIANSKALIFSGIFFINNDKYNFLKIGKKLLYKNINIQILNDGGHYERSPMYHSIVLEDLLDIYKLVNNNNYFSKNEILNLEKKIISMLIWLKKLSHKDGKISFFNDSAFNISKCFSKLSSQANELGLKFKLTDSKFTYLKETGYFIYTDENIDLKFNVGSVGPKEQPGHSHADTLSFELSIGKFRTFVNSGTSTYEDDSLRSFQKSTKAHNTLEINKLNSSNVWSSFRVGKRAKVCYMKYNTSNDNVEVEATHDGYYQSANINHKRKINIVDNKIIILDTTSEFCLDNVIRLYLNPDIMIEEAPLKLITVDGYSIDMDCNNGAVRVVDAMWYPEFGIKIPNKCIEITMKEANCETIINWKKSAV